MDRKLRLRELREEHDMSQRDLAKAVNVCPATICHWETGKKDPTLLNLLALADLFHCSLDDLCVRERTPA